MVRPLKFETPEQIKTAAQTYFAKCEKDDEPLTITGLALALGTNRQTLINYEERDEFFDTIKTLKTIIENYAEKRLFGGAPAGAIFALKNFGWKDSQDLNHGGQTNNPVNVLNIIGGKS